MKYSNRRGPQRNGFKSKVKVVFSYSGFDFHLVSAALRVLCASAVTVFHFHIFTFAFHIFTFDRLFPIFAPMHFLYLLNFWQYIQPYDLWLIKHINQNWSNPFLDFILPFFRETTYWMPLYLFLVLFTTINFKMRGWWWVAGFLLTAAISDLISSQVIKQLIIRVRPCQDLEVAPMLRFFINYCPGSSSFTSSHSTSHFAQGVFFFLTLKNISKWSWIFLVWAFLIAYTQVYVGVHYPFDVFCGAIIGSGIGLAISKLFHKKIGMLSLDK